MGELPDLGAEAAAHAGADRLGRGVLGLLLGLLGALQRAAGLGRGRRRRARGRAAAGARSRSPRRRARGRPRPAATRRRRAAPRRLRGEAPAGSPKRASTAAMRSCSAGLARHRFDRRAADLGLQRRRRALGDDLAVVDDPDPVGERVGLLQVLGGEEDGDAVLGGEPRDLVPERGAALDVEAGGRLVEEEDARAGGRAPAPGRAGASSRPSSRRPCGRPPRRGRPARAARRRARSRSALAMPCSAVCRRMCSRPVSSGSSAASCSAAPIDERTCGPSLTMSKPATRAVPAVGGSSVVSISTVVDLPAPLGPRKP